MAEIENPHFLKGHKFDLKQVRLDLYRLVCYFEASRSIAAQHTHDAENSNLQALPREFIEDEVGRILLQTAIVLRILDDESPADREEKNPFYCGTLRIGEASEKLPLREACNKIIHAQRVNFDIETLEGVEFVAPFLHFYGTKGKAEWKASIEMREFMNYSAELLRARSLAEHIEWSQKFANT